MHHYYPLLSINIDDNEMDNNQNMNSYAFIVYIYCKKKHSL